ncbi:MAG: hypothetical protein A2268_11130 [Candidatus Raymondbacteria bacterium RifOxyA12_full_50_37]|uniref:FlgD Ig-like domain-containing protein n=1 Tax=Candidatus Raymondbacteria bacterium RIFOXYD12_FULL_49_13 TaxID=1817890 RepID=A0A1F7F7C8_UNCRA|nr:MAG: hypothetical protein A2268_11130 [Candidatus Raymondbacteria bacterium RifOxyA12_full_50_37]OGJ85564.1 MAG: hypothetical protein A2248_12915 [Candidatus Raymondbacteria bacterium RIFOXYA2_FULL_49_16]OGJ92816.1 MAG: hypothetical protein A2350_16865 [Candidatus Raymondbacteria bacterium RifOxyB12_full_50_8]OGJ95067.1 MAG: hypothetical protein A2453_07615 [Candidatus Raymondbacteria bacterium RIFOXYC2_FULL_50_21]OGK02585.1 MAG: hypothetical protein A2519_12275 [Candidatus Raymondbacteria b
MKKILSTVFVLCVVFLAFGQKDTVKVYAIDNANAPTIDGSLADWDEAYVVRANAFTSENQIYYISGTDMSAFSGIGVDYDAKVYMSHDQDNLYIGWQVLADDYPLSNAYGWQNVDNMRISFGAKDDWMYIYNAPILADSNPRTLAYDYLTDGALVAVTVQDLPIYEVKIPLLSIPRFYPTNPPFALMSVGTEDQDLTDGGHVYWGLGATYTGDKHDAVTNPWDNSAYYPIVQIRPENPTKVENAAVAQAEAAIAASPNPFNPATTISYTMKSTGSINIYTSEGKLIKSFTGLNNSGAVAWNGTDACGNTVAAGIYIAQLVSKGNVFNTKLAYTK